MLEQDWVDDLRMKKVLISVQNTGVVTGFVVGDVLHQEGDVLFLSVGNLDMELHKQYVHRVLTDDEAIPTRVDGLPLLRF